MADGTVTIETKLDNSGAEKGLNDLKKEVESSSKSTAQEIDKASDQAQKSVEEVAKSAEKTGKQVEKSAKDSASKAGQAAKQGADTAAKGTESASTKMQQSHKKVKDTAKESADGAKKSWEESNQSTVASTESATSKMAGLMKKSAAVIGVASVATAKKTIDVGKSFEAGMSEVQAISGASGKDLEKTISESSFIIVPSEWYETFGLSAAEAMPLSKPVIASNIGGLPEIVENGITGYLFDYGNTESLYQTIQTAINIDDCTYYQMCNNAYNFIRKFSEEKYINNIIELYQNNLKKKIISS